ncbi:hypothetical protein HPP92_021434 [Vanilla planifolia]|uniref:Glycosyltransferase n=1 Tax=Vanilla planifolia TaxID=51239 RepID=A0A835Q1J5_VANPL|nr:hypothetical protein HPP92_021434 [Vanilla planifolia]
MEQKRQPHILIATYPIQGHINPTLRLAKRLARVFVVRITISTAVEAQRRMFPSSPDSEVQLEENPLFSFIPYSNGYDDGFDPKKHDWNNYMSRFKEQGSYTLASVVDSLAARGRPVTCIIHSFMMSWVADVAKDCGIPSFFYCIQPATVFTVYWHYFHEYKSVIAANALDPSAVISLPCLPSMRIRDLPSCVTAASPDEPNGVFLQKIKETFDRLDVELGRQGSIPLVLVNTADELEARAMASVSGKVELVGIGPLLEDAAEGSLFKAAEEKGYMDWLDRQAERSVVYVSFGSLSMLKKEQMEEIWKVLREGERPYLWVVRKDNRWEGLEFEGDDGKGMIVAWCEQGRVLGHRAVGCFVTHCGWNSTVESLLCGVPTVAVPQWLDQATNAWLMETEWGTGVRVEVSGEGLVEAEELRRCVERVMGEEGKEIRTKAATWKDKSRDATGEGGPSDRNLKAFAQKVISLCHVAVEK